MPASHVPEGFHTVTPYLIVDGAAKLIDFMRHVFEAEEVMCMKDADGRVAHASLRVGDSMVEVSDAHGEWKAMPGSLHVYVPDTDAIYRQALEAGAESLREPEDMFYGERGASVRDPVGNLWHIATLIEEVSEEEVRRRVAEMQSQSA